MTINRDTGTAKLQEDRRMLRRSMLAVAGSATAAFAGCSDFMGSSTPPPPSTNGSESTSTPIQEADPPATPDPRTVEAFQTAAAHLERAFAEWQKANPFKEDSDYVKFRAEPIREFSLPTLLNEVEKARQTIERGQRDEHRDSPYVASLKAAAKVVEYGGRGYDAIGRTYLHHLRHRKLYVETRDYEKAAVEAKKALRAVREISAQGYFDEAVEGYKSIRVNPELEGFDLKRWGDDYIFFVQNFGRRQPAVMDGSRRLSRAMHAFTEAAALVRERTDLERAETLVSTALDRLAAARKRFETAIDMNAGMFRNYWQGRLYCHTDRYEDPMQLYLRGVREFQDGNPTRGEGMVDGARSSLTEAALRCA